jgi:hypothetical protein
VFLGQHKCLQPMRKTPIYPAVQTWRPKTDTYVITTGVVTKASISLDDTSLR